jgi:threonine/homoserine/homoserine lactone efflux protein
VNELFAAVPVALLLVFFTGPVFFVVIETSITKGVRRAFLVDLGAVLADLVFVTIATYGTQTLKNNLEENPQWLILGGFMLCLYGAYSYLVARNEKNTSTFNLHLIQKAGYLHYLAKGFFLNIINIGTFLFWLGLVVLDVGFLFITIVVFLYLVIDIIKIYLAKQLKDILTLAFIYKIKQTTHVIILLFGLFFVFQGVFPQQQENLRAILETQTN